MTLALDEFKHIKQWCLRSIGIGLVNENVLAALEEALAKQEQGEPVAWWVTSPDGELDDSDGPIKNKEERPLDELIEGCGYAPLYTTPQPAQKPWVGLTDEEEIEIIEKYMTTIGLGEMFIDEVEAKLKEKNSA